MVRSPARLAAVSLACLLLPAGLARADLINWSYSWSPATQTLAADPTPGGRYLGNVTLSSFGGTTGSQPGEQVGLAAAYVTYTYSSQAPDGLPVHFSHFPFHLALALTDSASHQSGSLTYAGFVDGDLSATSSSLRLTVDSPTAAGLTLGGHYYAVGIGPYIAPPYPAANFPGVLVANVTVTDMQNAPEPATLVLAGLALPVLGLNAGRKRRRLSA